MRLTTAFLLATVAATVASCGPRQPNPPQALAQGPAAPARPRNVVLIIGDGMGPQQVGLLELYARRAPGSPYTGPTAFQRMADTGSLGLSLHYPMDKTVVDSACSATQLALGVPAPSEAIGVDATGEPQQTVLELARSRGMATGLVSDTRLTHATPAAFGAHVAHRSHENTIAEQLLHTGPDVMLSGGWRHWIPQSADGSRRDDDRDLLKEAEAQGYTVVKDRQALSQAGQGKLLGLFSRSGMMDAIEERRTRDADDRTEPALHEMATVALDRLAQDEDGFFVMIESGQIDWSCHSNDAGWLLAEMRRADELLTTVLDWAEGRDDTLVVVTADHETGGFGLSYSRSDIPEPRDLPGSAFSDEQYAPNWNFGPLESLDGLAAQEQTWEDVLRAFSRLPESEQTPEVLAERISAVSAFDLDVEGARRVLQTRTDPWSGEEGPVVHDFGAFYYPGAQTALVGRELGTAQNVVWATGTHTHTPVPVLAIGPGAEDFAGMHHHTDLGQLLKRAVGGE